MKTPLGTQSAFPFRLLSLDLFYSPVLFHLRSFVLKRCFSFMATRPEGRYVPRRAVMTPPSFIPDPVPAFRAPLGGSVDHTELLMPRLDRVQTPVLPFGADEDGDDGLPATTQDALAKMQPLDVPLRRGDTGVDLRREQSTDGLPGGRQPSQFLREQSHDVVEVSKTAVAKKAGAVQDTLAEMQPLDVSLRRGDTGVDLWREQSTDGLLGGREPSQLLREQSHDVVEVAKTAVAKKAGVVFRDEVQFRSNSEVWRRAVFVHPTLRRWSGRAPSTQSEQSSSLRSDDRSSGVTTIWVIQVQHPIGRSSEMIFVH